ncbi:MAG TPA: phosphatidate cytidylyltransferase [Azospira sp.]|nr:phosphatidate cytidylyltransferase [Azospira sp.]
MLRARVITAVFLLLGFLGAVFLLPPLGWTLLVTMVTMLAAWEWGGLMGLGGIQRVALGLASGVPCTAIMMLWPEALGLSGVLDKEVVLALAWWFLLPAVLFWTILVPLWLGRRFSLVGALPGLLTGAVVLLPTWLALVLLRHLGAWALLGIMALVWIADIAAYFTGRAFGRRKLAPQISPGKTWEGAYGAVVGVLVYGLVLHFLFNPAAGVSLFLLVPALLALTAVSIIGDLFESLLKRQAGIKDSSQLLPGHGGILDRIDSLTSTLPLVTLLWLLV